MKYQSAILPLRGGAGEREERRKRQSLSSRTARGGGTLGTNRDARCHGVAPMKMESETRSSAVGR